MKKRKDLVFLLLILIVAAFFRLWGSWRLDLFTYDQARDATYIRRIFTEMKIPLIGPQSSIPGVSLGPGYYYLMAFPLLLSGFDPAVIDVMVGLGGVLTTVVLYRLLAEETDKRLALAIALLYSVSPIVIELSRRAWNLSTLPLFLVLALYSLQKIHQSKDNLVFWTVLLFVSLGMAIQLHYSALLLIPGMGLSLFFWDREKVFKNVKPFLMGAMAFVLVNLPILVFNLRHQWTMPRAIVRVFFQEKAGGGVGDKVRGFFLSFWHLYEGTFLYNLRPISFAVFGLIVLLIIVNIIKRKKSVFFGYLMTIILVGILGSQFYPKGFSFFYFVFLLPIPYLLLGVSLNNFGVKKALFQKLILIAFIPLAVYLTGESGKIIFRKPVRTRNDFKEVASIIAGDIQKGTPFNLVAVYQSPGGWENFYRRGIVREDIRWDHNAVDYGYFVESLGYKPLPWDNFSSAEVLYLIAETEVKEPLSLKFWEISQFSPKKVAQKWQLPNGTAVFRLEK